MSRRFAILAVAVTSLLGAGILPTVEAQVQGPEIWMSFRGNTEVPGVGTVTDEDIVIYDESTGSWSLGFDGSDVGLGSKREDVDTIGSNTAGSIWIRQDLTMLGISASADIGSLHVVE